MNGPGPITEAVQHPLHKSALGSGNMGLVTICDNAFFILGSDVITQMTGNHAVISLFSLNNNYKSYSIPTFVRQICICCRYPTFSRLCVSSIDFLMNNC